MNYVTNDLFRAAALIIKTKEYPDHYYTTGEKAGNFPVVYMAWNDMPDKYVKQLEAGELLVDPVSLKQIYRTLRTELREQPKEHDNENTTSKAATG